MNSRFVGVTAGLGTPCQHVQSPESGARVIEALASGIPTINEALDEYGLPPAHYIDSGIRFTVVLHAHATRRPRTTAEPTALETRLGRTERRVYDALSTRGRTVDELSDELGLSAPNVRKTLRRLRDRGLVLQQGGKGQATAYQRVTS